MVGVATAGHLCSRSGSHRATILAGLGCCLFLALMSLAPTLSTLIAALVCFGFCTAVMDVSMNTNGVAVEKTLPKPIMSSLHGMFSLGGLVFAGVGWAVVRAGIAVPGHFIGAAIAFAGALLFASPKMLESAPPPDQKAAAFVLPEKAVMVVGLIAFCAFLSEGAMGDWSAIYMRKVLHQSPATSTLGYLAFALSMTSMRFGGDALLHRWGSVTTLRVCGTITTVGMILALWFVVPWLTVVGFASVGLGMAIVAPIAFSLGGRLGGDRPDHAIASIATMGYSAFLVGPAVIGFMAKQWSLREALILVVVLAISIVTLSGFASKK